MTSPVNYELNESVATITLDDGKVNVLGPTMQAAINEALDHAEKDDAKAIVLAGNPRVFSGGFDLCVFHSGDARPRWGCWRAASSCRSGPDVPGAGDHGGDRSGDRDGLLPAAERRPPGGRGEVAVPGHRGRDRDDDADLGDRDHADAADARGVPPGCVDGGDVRRRRRDGGGLAGRDRRRDKVLARAQEVAAEAAATLHAGAHLASKLKAREYALAAIRAGIDGLPTEFAAS